MPQSTESRIIIEKLVLWVIFNVVIALLPFIFRAIGSSILRKTVRWETVLADGELLLVAAAVAAGAIGELLIKGKQLAIARMIAGGGSIICLTLSSLLYALIHAQKDIKNPTDPNEIFKVSIVLFVSTFVAGGGCIVLSELKE